MAQHARKNARAQCVTANRLIDGEVVYLVAGGGWSTRFEDAAISTDPATAQRLMAQAQTAVDNQHVVETYLFEVAPGDDGATQAVSVREQIRMRGPTVRLDLGKQAEAK